MGHNELKLKIINEECRIKNLDIESSNPMRLGDAISVTPYIHSGAEFVRGDARIERPMPHASGRRYLRNPVHTQRSGVCAGDARIERTIILCVWKTLSP